MVLPSPGLTLQSAFPREDSEGCVVLEIVWVVGRVNVSVGISISICKARGVVVVVVATRGVKPRRSYLIWDLCLLLVRYLAGVVVCKIKAVVYKLVQYYLSDTTMMMIHDTWGSKKGQLGSKSVTNRYIALVSLAVHRLPYRLSFRSLQTCIACHGHPAPPRPGPRQQPQSPVSDPHRQLAARRSSG